MGKGIIAVLSWAHLCAHEGEGEREGREERGRKGGEGRRGERG